MRFVDTSISSDILQAPEDALVFIPVNRVGVMGAGLAKQFAHKHPNLFEEYRRACKTEHAFESPMVIDRYLMFPTKNHWSEKSDIDSIVDYMTLVINDLIHNPSHFMICDIAVPKLGCGLGGLNWYDLRPRLLPLLEKFEYAGGGVILYE